MDRRVGFRATRGTLSHPPISWPLRGAHSARRLPIWASSSETPRCGARGPPRGRARAGVDAGGETRRPALDADGERDSTDEALLRVALDEMETHPDVSAAGEAIRYLYRLSCNVADSPEEPRFRRLRVDNRAYVNHALGVRGGTLAMEALGWRVSEDGSACVLSESRGIGERTLQTLQDRIKAMVAKLAARQAAEKLRKS